MTVLSRPRHPLVDDALALARVWCDGHVIDGSPAVGHAVKVARTLGRHLLRPHPELIAAALLHDAPFFAPAGLDLDLMLTTRFGPGVTRTVRALEREHETLDTRCEPAFADADRWTVHAVAADKIVSINAVLRRAGRAADLAEFWRPRSAFVSRVPYFRAFACHAAGLLPPLMAAELSAVVSRANTARQFPPGEVSAHGGKRPL